MKENEMSSSQQFMKTAGKSWSLLRDMATCVVFPLFNLSSLSLSHLSTFVKSLVRSEGEVFQCGAMRYYSATKNLTHRETSAC